ncbi:MAG: hypothetical protein PHX83_16980 [Acidobacteriia bacterium]|nr:hypothetical protein [Terriglobia bacterium]
MSLFKRSIGVVAFLMLCCFVFVSAAPAQNHWSTSAAETFDLSGMPPRPTNFVEQQIFEFVRTHRRGDLANAALIQHKLAKYYADKGDMARSREAEHRATLAEGSTSSNSGVATHGYGEVPGPTYPNPGPSTPPGNSGYTPPSSGPSPRPTPGYTPIPMAWETCEQKNPMFAGTPAPFSGIWYLYNGGSSEETWEFFGDSMFRHTWISAGVGTSVRTSERGRFHVSGNSITLHITSQSGGSVSGSSSGGSILTGGTQCKDETKQMSFRLLGNQGDGGIVLNGTTIKFRSR